MCSTFAPRLFDSSTSSAESTKGKRRPKAALPLPKTSWAQRYIAKLRSGETISFRPRGHSMTGRIESGQFCTVIPIDPPTLRVGDIVCRVTR
jgi:hypothetical protein